ncbi:MAG: hypothetical protein IJU46_02725 [Clostridia bacterium]|nr:hypothetical protein [Clostridia bacterium]
MEKNLREKLDLINGNRDRGPAALRIASELTYLDILSKYDRRVDEGLMDRAAGTVCRAIEERGAVTPDVTAEAEVILAPLSAVAKDYSEIFCAHAHIDFNYRWGFNETAALTLDTFRTVLDFMKEYPSFTFAQSQASLYRIVELFRPSMLVEIRERIKSGQWEVTASEWVEPDKNLPSGESLTRQILEARKYLIPLLGLRGSDFDLCFEPDTFGHSAYVPEILADAGIKYMYHCRGYEKELYRYVAPSGRSTINLCEYDWYSVSVSPEKFETVADFCGKTGMKTHLCVYGVGDHGGGPSRRDIERIAEYASWPLTPSIRFGKIRDFFAEAEKISGSLPEVKHELNCLYTGCYSSQSRIKAANRTAEARMFEAESLSAMNRVFGGEGGSPDMYGEAWRNILSLHFHDIITGTCRLESREYAMKQFDTAMAYIGTGASASMRAISDMTDTSPIQTWGDAGGTSEGAGAGFAQNESHGYLLPSAERGSGSTRIFTVFNPTSRDRAETASVQVWDYGYDTSLCEVSDGSGEPLPFSLSGPRESFWGHRFITLEVFFEVPAFGYTTVVLRRRRPEGHLTAPHEGNDSFTESPDSDRVLDNGLLRAVFDGGDMTLKSFSVKGEELSAGGGYFRLVSETPPSHGRTAWLEGQSTDKKDLNRTCPVRFGGISRSGLSDELRYSIAFGRSKLDVKVRLGLHSRTLEYTVTADWDEKPEKGASVPRLEFVIPAAYTTSGRAVTDVPMGRLSRADAGYDLPCQSYIVPLNRNEDGECLALMSGGNYGFRSNRGETKVTLIRGTYDPDPYPERGIHVFRIGVAAAGVRGELAPALSSDFRHPLPAVSATRHGGSLPLRASALKVTGAEVSAFKISEDGEGVAVRLHGNGAAAPDVTDSGKQTAGLSFYPGAGKVSAVFTDSTESLQTGAPECEGGDIKAEIGRFSCETLVIKTGQ